MKYNYLRKIIPRPIFSKQDLRLLGGRVFDYQLSLWQKQGHIIKIKNGLYLLADSISKISLEEISAHLYAPSYVSLERALAYYGFIPEMVYAVTCVTSKTTRRFKNNFGSFIYRHILPSLFFGYHEVKGEYISFLLAEPEKALLDFVYLNLERLKTAADLKEMRFNRIVIRKSISSTKFKKYLKFYKNDKMNIFCESLIC